jgi:hypothetical protein
MLTLHLRVPILQDGSVFHGMAQAVHHMMENPHLPGSIYQQGQEDQPDVIHCTYVHLRLIPPNHYTRK